MRQYRAVIIGIRSDTATVEKVWIQNDSGMSDGGRLHYPSEGRTSAGEAMIVFGLTRFREFSVDEGEVATAYTVLLQTDLDRGTPANDEP
jgi:hypothetical protein